ncbi:MAG TPA: adenylate/guanylate cyclase domain-containing protein [Candidatus Binatia bacterium]|nr:adenylate/guanylate cyclase domain-containing protein [Candidatus Binatia bacterium]
MKFSDIVKQAVILLRESGRMTYRTLKREFALEDEALEDLKFELIDGQRVAVDEDGKVLVWIGEGINGEKDKGGKGKKDSSEFGVQSSELKPITYTPPHLAERIRAEQAAMEARGATDGERKTITALFADLKGSTALIEGLDPEEARAIIDPALQLMMDAVHRYDGYVAQALGDGIFALFGAPLAHEDHPQRALYAALRMQEEMHRYADTLQAKGHPPLLMRVGVNTGEVVVRSIRKDDLHADYVPVGHSTNLAARMEQLAAPGSILATAYTHRLTDGYFAFKDLGKTQIKGVEDPLNVYEVIGAGPLRTRLQVSARRGLTRFVGRQSEMEQMQRALAQAKAGHGQIVGVMGEPGLGKSRLFYEFKLTSQSGCLVLEAYSVSHGKAAPYLPVIELLKSYFQIHPQDEERLKQEKVTGKVLTLERSLEDTLPYLFALLGIDDPQATLAQMDPQIRRKRTFAALKRLFFRESLKQPLMLIFEDLHWIDSETQGFLDVLSESVASARILLLVNYRPEYRHEWGSKTYYTQLRLAPLGKDEAEELLTFLLGNDASLKALQQLILEKTEGTPFFMEEVVQELVARAPTVGAGFALPAEGAWPVEEPGRSSAPTALHIPTTVQGVLAARIDRLRTGEKALLQQLAVIGREFPLSLVRQVVLQPEEELYRLLSSLQRKEFLYEQPAFPEVEYAFKHALTQEVAYGSVLQERRKAWHEQTAQAIEVLFHSRLEDHYGELAHHYSRSSNTQKAVEYLQLAGQQAVQRSAHAEAIGHMTTALELLKTLPDTPERTQQELRLQIALGVPLVITKGYSASEVGAVYSRARELCQQMGETPQRFSVLWGLWAFYNARAEFHTSHELGEQLLRLAETGQDLALLVEAHFALGDTLVCLGEFVPARAQLEKGIVLYNPLKHGSHAFLYGQDPGVGALSWAVWALWFLGSPAQALKRTHEALTLAQGLSHPYSLVYALIFAALLHRDRREVQLVRERAEAVIGLCTEQRFSFFLAMGTMLHGWVLVQQGQGETGIGQIHEGLAAYQTTRADLWRPYFLFLLAEAYGHVGQTEEGLSVLAEALEAVHKTGERMYEAELYQLKGELSLQSAVHSPQSEITSPQHPTPNTQQEAEACFLKAIEIARRQQAKSLELRAVTSLARLWHQQGKKVEARQILAEIYGWFTEGFDTKDLQEAKALLDELAR